MTLEDIMKDDVECCGPADTVQSAARQMREANIGFLPVCGDDGRVIGTLTDRDIALRFVADALPFDTQVEKVMSREIIACAPTDSLRKAEQLMGEYHKSRLLCLDDGKLVGVVSLSDIAKGEPETSFVAETLREITYREAQAS